MDTRLIEYVLEIAEQKSISKAAENLFITQPALSQQLKKLEAEIGQPLFYSANKELHLTDAGRIYTNSGQAILHVKKNTLDQLAAMQSRAQSMIRFIYTADDILMPLASFYELYPDIDLQKEKRPTTDAIQALLKGDADIAVFPVEQLHHSLLEFIPLRKDNLFLILPDSHPANQIPDPFAENYDLLKGDTFFLHRPDTLSRQVENSVMEAFHMQAGEIFEVPNYIAEVSAVQHHFGDAFLPAFFLQENAGYKSYPLSDPAFLYLVVGFHKQTILSEPMKHLIYSLLEYYDIS